MARLSPPEFISAALTTQAAATSKTTFHDILFDAGVRGQMGEFGDYFKNWNWELGFRYSRNDEETLTGGVVSETGLRDALLDTDPATAFNPFLGFRGRNTEAAISRVYVTLHNTGQFELPLAYFHLDGDLFNLPAGPVSFAAGLEYRGERWRNNPDSENASFDAIGTFNFQASKVNRDVWGTYQEVRIPVTSPAGIFQEHTVSSSTSPSAKNGTARIHLQLPFCLRNTPSLMRRSRNFPFAGSRLTPSGLARSPYVALIAKGFMRRHYPTLRRPRRRFSLSHPLKFAIQRGKHPTAPRFGYSCLGIPLLKPEVAYEWSYGAVYSPKWIRGLTLSADFWHIDLRSLAALPDGQFILAHEKLFPQDVIRDPTTGAITTVINPTLNLTRRRGGRSRLRSDLYPGFFELWSWRFWQIYLYPQRDLPVPVRASDKSRHSPIWDLGYVCISTDLNRLAAAHSSLCQRVLGRPG